MAGEGAEVVGVRESLDVSWISTWRALRARRFGWVTEVENFQMTDSHLHSWTITQAITSRGEDIYTSPVLGSIPVCDQRDTVLQRGCGLRVPESSVHSLSALPPCCTALLQKLLSLCLEFVNNLVSIIPGIELLISGVVMDHRMTSRPPGEEQFGQIILTDNAQRIIDTGDAVRAVAARAIDHIKNPTQKEGGFSILAPTWSVP